MPINLSNELRKIKIASPGMQVTDLLTAESWNAIRNSIVGMSQGAMVRSGGNIRLKNGPDWFMVSADRTDEAASSASEETWPLQAYQSTYEGEGDPPEDQALRYKIRVGKVNHFTPSNIDSEFTAPASQESYAWLKVTLTTSTGRPSAVEIETGDEVPETPEAGGSGEAPSVTYRGIARITADGSSITAIDPVIKDSQWVAVILSSIDLESGSFILDVIWTSATDGTSIGLPA